MVKARACLICQSPNINFLFKKKKRSFFVCQNCGLKFIQPIPKEIKIEQYYQAEYWQRKSYRGESALGYLSYLAEKESFLDYFKKILHQLKRIYQGPSGRVLDIGCSFGFFLKVAQAVGWQIYGVDLSPTPVDQAKKELGVKTIYNKSVDQAKFKANFFDLVTVFQTIEHMAILKNSLYEIKRILKPQGVVLLTTPDAGGWQAKIMGKSWFSYRHPDHFYFFDFKNLSFLLKNTGFVKIRKLKDPTRLYPLSYLLENFKFYYRGKYLVGLAELIQKVIGPLGKIKIPIPLVSLVIIGEKE